MSDYPRAHIQAGIVEGVQNDGVLRFLGIPYARPPLGPLRFLPPQPCDAFSGVYDATYYRDSPMQFTPNAGGSSSPYAQDQRLQPPLTYSEDCLYLNVWTPEDAGEAPLPVLYWVYGGAYCMGSASMDVYNGASLAKKGMVVVTVNYRLGIFGFLPHPALMRHAPYATNAGLWDLIAGLQWVRENIAAFHGDPDNVTINGESAGSAAVNTLLVCPAAKGLFHRAITQSFSPFNHDEWAHDQRSLQRKSDAFLRSIGIETEQALFSAPSESLLGPDASAYRAAEYSPYVDKSLLPEHLEQAFLRGHIHDVPILIGCTADEATSLIGDPKKVTVENFMSTLRRKYPDHTDVLYKTYKNQLLDNPAMALARFRSENTLANMRFFARVLRSHLKEPQYFYVFSRIIPGVNESFFRAYHAGELPYHFGNLRYIDRPFTDADEKLSQTMMAYWTSFAQKGNPNAPSLPPWGAFTPKQDRIMYLDAPCRWDTLINPKRIDFLYRLLYEKVQRNNPDSPMPL